MSYIGIDVGTSGTKAICLANDGSILGKVKKEYGFISVKNGFRELDADNLYEVVCDCISEIAGDSVQAVTISSLGEAIVLVNTLGKPISNIMTGTDFRGDGEFSSIVESLGKEALIRITGLNLSTIYSLNKILWFKRKQPALYKQAKKICTVQDYLIGRLCNEYFIDYSMASRTMMFDINTMDWSDEILDCFSLHKDKFSIPLPSGSIAGTIQNDVAKSLGLNNHVKIVLGTHDHISNAIGAGVCRVGMASNSVGTTEGITAILGSEKIDSELINKFQISCQPFPTPSAFNTVAWNNTSGALLKWYKNEFCKDYSKDINPYDYIESSIPKDPTKLMVLPHFSGAGTPHMDELSRGAIIGLTLESSREEIYKALIEGANFELKQIIECHMLSGIEINQIVSTGTAASTTLLQIKANILGIPINTVKCDQTGAFGAAILASVACGQFDSIENAIDKFVEFGTTYYPNISLSEFYNDKYEIYKTMYSCLSELHHSLAFEYKHRLGHSLYWTRNGG